MVAILDSPPAERLTLTELAREQGVAPPTTWRWMTRGVAGVKLPAVYIGSKPYTSRTVFSQWCEDVTAAKRGESPVTTQTNRSRAADAAKATRGLADRHGL